ncbi:MAG TPA: BBE domain-containing protein [Candidatus Polarisedimenticolia bacterium]|nr:BBE domain-containing protein [Candidatus Polarisedimenticolia bacterium]
MFFGALGATTRPVPESAAYPHLARVKRAYDSDNLFRMIQNIKPA